MMVQKVGDILKLFIFELFIILIELSRCPVGFTSLWPLTLQTKILSFRICLQNNKSYSLMTDEYMYMCNCGLFNVKDFVFLLKFIGETNAWLSGQPKFRRN